MISRVSFSPDLSLALAVAVSAVPSGRQTGGVMSSSHFNMAVTTPEDTRLKDSGASSNTVSSSASNSSSTSSSSVQPRNIRELLWEERAKTLRELISNYRLPLAVKLKSGDISSLLCTGQQKHNENNNENGVSHSFIHSPQFSSGQESGFPGVKDADISTKGCREEEAVLQIHETRRRKIILARKMTWEKRQNDYVVTGEQVEIPASFKGRPYVRG
ncbi:hypothetical protein PoB_006366700 [Plakobranchus ocellatus]|uniref:Uncharacterized protein n=1 Tax=Plakobranchus ocellatus TaxID=259542 RepID=A0AAV4CYY6_9GAST|nr:hypothetical protein PoB_006366700 [Plakobranchus ocellatus]